MSFAYSKKFIALLFIFAVLAVLFFVAMISIAEAHSPGCTGAGGLFCYCTGGGTINCVDSKNASCNSVGPSNHSHSGYDARLVCGVSGGGGSGGDAGSGSQCGRCSTLSAKDGCYVEWQDTDGNCNTTHDASSKQYSCPDTRCVAGGDIGGDEPPPEPTCTPNTTYGSWDYYCSAGNVHRSTTTTTTSSSCGVSYGVARERHEDCGYGCESGECLPATVFVSLTADPESGEEPLDTTLEAEITGTADGLINYHFWWDCDDTSNSVSGSEDACGGLANPAPGTCAGNSNGYRCVGVNRVSEEIHHRYLAELVMPDVECHPDKYRIGTYRTKVIAERDPAPVPGVDHATITVDPLVIPCELPDPKEHSDIDNEEAGGIIGETVADMIRSVLRVSAFLLIFLYILAGLKLLTDGANSDSVASAKRIFIYTTVGYGVILLGWVLTYAVR